MNTYDVLAAARAAYVAALAEYCAVNSQIDALVAEVNGTDYDRGTSIGHIIRTDVAIASLNTFHKFSDLIAR